MTRDRDATGRPRQARPRDELGRPLPYGAVGVEPVSEEPLPPMESLALARSLLDDGRPFAAHEVLEARWKAGPAQERDLWQGLAQLCVALTHSARGNTVGAARLVERGAGKLAAYSTGGGPGYGLDLDAVAAWARGHVGAGQAPAPGSGLLSADRRVALRLSLPDLLPDGPERDEARLVREEAPRVPTS